MNNFIFKSANRLIKNSPITLDSLMHQVSVVQEQNRHLRQDLVDINLKLNKLLIDKHLQMQADEYFEDTPKLDEQMRDLD